VLLGPDIDGVSTDISGDCLTDVGTHAVTVTINPGLVKAVAGLGSLTLSDGVWADPQRRLSVQ
jgi:hypothetical protein